MGTTRRKFTLEFRTDAAHRVIDTGRTIIDVAGELLRLRQGVARPVGTRRAQAPGDGGWEHPRAFELSGAF